MRVESGQPATRKRGGSRLILVLFLLPLLALLGWWTILIVSLETFVFPPAWLILLSLGVPLCLACLVLFVSRAVVFGFFRDFSLRVRNQQGEDEGEELPFLLFHSGQELEMLTETLAAWKEDVSGLAGRLAGQTGLWALEPQARFPWAGRSELYQRKSAELKKAKGHCQFRTAACLAVFALPPESESGGRKRFDWLADFAGSVADIAEEEGGFVGLLAGQALVVVFSLGRDERVLAIRAAKAAQQLQQNLHAEYPGSSIRIIGDIFPVVEGIVQAGSGLRYYIDAPEIGALRLAASSPIHEGGLKFSSRLVSTIKTGGRAS